jgi:hypothetical protein
LYHTEDELESVNPLRFIAPVQTAPVVLPVFMPTKKQPTRPQREVAGKKNQPVTKTPRPAVTQNGEANPPPREEQNSL